MAAGRPVIYSDLKAIHLGVPEIVNDSLVKPNNLELIVQKICHYIEQPNFYKEQSSRNLSLAQTKYNWELQNNRFIHFINHL